MRFSSIMFLFLSSSSILYFKFSISFSVLDKFFSEREDATNFTKTVNAVKYLAKLNLITTSYRGIREFKEFYPESEEAKRYISLNAFSTKGKIRFLFVKYNMAWLFVTLFKIAKLLMK